jgi:asparagine synthase (glutamine-hydrolysing)
MCGIVAIFDKTGAPTLDSVRCGLNALRHRGPDAVGTWSSALQNVSLGNARLSIMDLTSGDQPLANEDGTLHATVNGEFYDFERIREELSARGHRFRTTSDSEIVLHLYEAYGADCVHRLRGEFAFILWDERNRWLFVARDRFGIKPLYYTEQNRRLLFASEVKALVAAGLTPAWDDEGFLQALTLAAPTGARCLFRNVKQIPPGHYLIATQGHTSLHQYWDFDYPEIADRTPAKADAEYAQQFSWLLEDAVRTRMRADVPVACYLSGGIDSSSILALMARSARQPIRAFSIGFDHPLYNESSFAREMARRVNAELVAVPVTQAILGEDFCDAVWHAETIFYNAHGVAKFALSRAVRDYGFKVVLTGEGADEILGGYPAFRLDAARDTNGSIPAAVRANLAAANTASLGMLIADTDVPSPPSLIQRLGYVPGWIEARESVFQRLRTCLSNALPSHDVHAYLLDHIDVQKQLTGRHALNQSLYLWNKTLLPNYILAVLGDRMEMAHSVEGRLPFLDHNLVEFTRTLPASQKIAGEIEKVVLRSSMQSLLPDSIRSRHKYPFNTPPAILMPNEPLSEFMQDTLRGPALRKLAFFDRRAVLQMLADVTSLNETEKIKLEVPLMMILSACVLQERFGL